MPDIDTLTGEYFVNVGDVAITVDTRPQTDTECRTTHLIDGTSYFGALREDIAALLSGGTERFFYTHSWYLGLPPTPTFVQIGEGTFTSAWQADAHQALNYSTFLLEDATGGPFHPMRDDLAQLAAAGVDVRILAWASPFLVNLQQAAMQDPTTFHVWASNVHTLLSVMDLRTLPGLGDKVVVNTMAHTLGSMHLKPVVCGDSAGYRGYTSGMDFVQNRNGPPIHGTLVPPQPNPKNYWHDVAMRVEGSGAGGLCRYFAALWNEQVRRSARTFNAFGSDIESHIDDTPLVEERPAASLPAGKQHTQVLRTVPKMNFAFFGTDRAPINCVERIISGFKQPKITFAQDGIFEFRAAQRMAVCAAERHIYIEDQSFWNFELADWANRRLGQVPALKVILLFLGDPLDPPSPLLPRLHGPPDRRPRHPRGQRGVCQGSVRDPREADDHRRPLGGDRVGELHAAQPLHGLRVVRLRARRGRPAFAARLRKDLWGSHCGKEPGAACDALGSLDGALGIWKPDWGMPPAGFSLRPDIHLARLPFVFAPKPVPDDAFPAPRRASFTPEKRAQADGDSRLEY
jgi:hypothetical protein